MTQTYQPFNQVRYDKHLAQIHSVNDKINISYLDNELTADGVQVTTKNIYVKENELEKIPLTTDLLNKLIGNRRFDAGDYVVRFENGKYVVRVEFDANDSWTVSVNEQECMQVKYLHELQNYIRSKTSGHILFLVDNSNTLVI